MNHREHQDEVEASEKKLQKAGDKLKAQIRANGRANGKFQVMLQMEYFKNNPSVTLPFKELDREQTINCYESVLYDFQFNGGKWLK